MFYILGRAERIWQRDVMDSVYRPNKGLNYDSLDLYHSVVVKISSEKASSYLMSCIRRTLYSLQQRSLT
jgi:hypothetical protein